MAIERVSLKVNGAPRELQVEPRRLLVQVLREDLDLTGTHVACDTSQCGACTVLLDGAAVKSCTMLAVQADGASVTTIEGLAASSARAAGDGATTLATGAGISSAAGSPTGAAAAAAGSLHPLQQAFWDKHGLQCGFCTPGMIMVAADLLSRNADPSETEIRHGIEGNYCRCTGYQNIVAAIRDAAATMRAAAATPMGEPGSVRAGSGAERHELV